MKYRTKLVVGLLAVFLMLMMPNVSIAESHYKKEVNQTDPIFVTVKGGAGIYIDIYGVDENTPVSTIVTGALSNVYSKYYKLQNRLYIHISTFKLFSGKINLNIYIGNQLWAYEATTTFFLLVKDITPIGK